MKNFTKVIVSVFCVLMLGYNQFGYAKFETKQVWDSYGFVYRSSAQDNQVMHSSLEEKKDYHIQILLSEVINEKEVEEIINAIEGYKEKGIEVHLRYDCVFSDNAFVKLFEGIKNNHLYNIKHHENLDSVFGGLSAADKRAFVNSLVP